MKINCKTTGCRATVSLQCMPGAQCLRCRPLKGKGKGVLGARETRGAREEGGEGLVSALQSG